MYSVDTTQEAEELLTAACVTNLNGEYVAAELIHEQTIEHLWEFSERLAKTHQRLKDVKSGR